LLDHVTRGLQANRLVPLSVVAASVRSGLGLAELARSLRRWADADQTQLKELTALCHIRALAGQAANAAPAGSQAARLRSLAAALDDAEKQPKH
jgi:hypothetical protein